MKEEKNRMVIYFKNNETNEDSYLTIKEKTYFKNLEKYNKKFHKYEQTSNQTFVRTILVPEDEYKDADSELILLVLRDIERKTKDGTYKED